MYLLLYLWEQKFMSVMEECTIFHNSRILYWYKRTCFLRQLLLKAIASFCNLCCSVHHYELCCMCRQIIVHHSIFSCNGDINPSYNYLFRVLETGQKDPIFLGCCTVQSSSSSVTFGYLRVLVFLVVKMVILTFQEAFLLMLQYKKHYLQLYIDT